MDVSVALSLDGWKGRIHQIHEPKVGCSIDKVVALL